MSEKIRPDDPIVYSNYVESTFNRGPRTVHNWIRDRLLPAPMKINGQNAWLQSQIDDAKRRMVKTNGHSRKATKR